MTARDGTYLEFSDREIEAGITYALEHEGVTLEKFALRTLANETRRLMATSLEFEIARYRALKALPQRTQQEQRERAGYSHAIASMCGRRAGHKKHGAAVAKKPKSRKSKVSIDEKGQGEFII